MDTGQGEAPSRLDSQSGIQKNDELTTINNQDIDSDHPLEHQFVHFNVGDTVNVEVYQASTGKTILLTVTLAAISDNT